MKRLAIIGAGGHGKVIADIAVLNGYEEIVFLDDNENIIECGSYPVIGRCKEAKELTADIIIGIGNAKIRKQIHMSLGEKNIVTLIHPDAVIAKGTVIGAGSVVMAGTVINPGVRIGKGCIINTCSSIDHDCNGGDFVHLAVGSHLCGMVTIKEETWIGAGATVSNNVSVCCDCVIGAGAVVVRDIRKPDTYIGVPAKGVKMKHKNTNGGGKNPLYQRKKSGRILLLCGIGGDVGC